MQYPGREDRFDEPPATDIGEVIDGVLVAIDGRIDRSVGLFGHSMGAAVAHAVADGLLRRGAPVEALFVSAHAPSDRADSAIHLLDDDELVAHLRSLGGTNAEVFEYPELLARVLPVVRNDYRLLAGGRATPIPPVPVPIVAYGADDDPLVPLPALDGWARLTTGGFRKRVFTGGHFYLAEVMAALAADVGRQLLTRPVARRGA